MDNKHLTLDERIAIKIGIDNGDSLAKIAKTINKDPRGVSREVKNHRKDATNYYANSGRCICALKHNCPLGVPMRGYAPYCNTTCKYYKRATCPKIERFPYVCGKCRKTRYCVCVKYIYLPQIAHKAAQNTLSECRKDSTFSEEEIKYLNANLKAGLSRGIPLAHIYAKDIKMQRICSLNYIYKLINKRILDLDAFDLRRKIRYKKRREKTSIALNRACRIGRTFLDYQLIKDKHSLHLQMDTVIGARGSSKVLLTLFIVETGFMYARLLEDKSALSVVKAFNDIQDLLGLEMFQKVFQCVLTDNGSEFYYVDDLELVKDTGEYRAHIYYCDPRNAQQKGAIEKNHEYIRYVLPHGASFNSLTQTKIDLLMSNINSIIRPRFKDCPYNLTVKLLGSNFLEALGIGFVENPNLTKELLK